MNDSIFVLLSKEGDPLDMANKRPISLLNVDYKIFASFLKNSVISKHLPNIISEEQLCGVQGRSIQDGVCQLRDLIEYYRDSKSNLCVISLDQRKVFDILDRDFLFEAMERLGFQISFININ
jgi:hypothetical protein